MAESLMDFSHRFARTKPRTEERRRNQPETGILVERKERNYKGISPRVIRRKESQSCAEDIVNSFCIVVVESPFVEDTIVVQLRTSNPLFGNLGSSIPIDLRETSVGIPIPPSPPIIPMPSSTTTSPMSDSREYNPYWMSVTPRPAREPYFDACEVCRRYVTMKPTNWKEMEMRKFQAKLKMEPAGMPSMSGSS